MEREQMGKSKNGRFIKQCLLKNREILAYIIVGVIVSAVNWVIYFLLVSVCGLGINISNGTAWMAAVLTAYILNKSIVFQSSSWKPAAIVKEFYVFVTARILSGILEICLVPFLMLIGMKQKLWVVEGGMAKLAAGFVVVAVNYLLSKKWIFGRE